VNTVVSNFMGERWVSASFAGSPWGPSGFRISSNGRALISLDGPSGGNGYRQYWFPAFKPNQGIWQSNFEWRTLPKGDWGNEDHLDIDETCPTVLETP
jgi:hypothetical protein